MLGLCKVLLSWCICCVHSGAEVSPRGILDFQRFIRDLAPFQSSASAGDLPRLDQRTLHRGPLAISIAVFLTFTAHRLVAVKEGNPEVESPDSGLIINIPS